MTMPVAHRVQPKTLANAEILLERLLAEWRNPQEDAHAPLIIEEAPSAHADVNHLYVIWEDWADVTPFERSKVILQACKQYRGRDFASSITLAMGLTPAEADRLGIATN